MPNEWTLSKKIEKFSKLAIEREREDLEKAYIDLIAQIKSRNVQK